MDFEEYVIKTGLKGSTAKDYHRRVKRICKNLNIAFDKLDLSNIDSVIDRIYADKSYVGTHGNSFVSALRKYKEFLNN